MDVQVGGDFGVDRELAELDRTVQFGRLGDDWAGPDGERE
jgi:hypothetical protein